MIKLIIIIITLITPKKINFIQDLSTRISLAEPADIVVSDMRGVLPLFDRLYDAPINFIIPRHEQGGCHMADAYARASGKVGVVLVTSGPGACNLVLGVGSAYLDRDPLLAFSACTATSRTHISNKQTTTMAGTRRPSEKICRAEGSQMEPQLTVK